MNDPDQRTTTRLRAVRRTAGRAALPLLLVSGVWLVGCGSDDADSGSTSELSSEDVSQTIEFTATEYDFSVDASTVIEPGEVVRFRLTNVGELDHEMEILDANGRLIDEIERLAPGESGEVLLSFESAGRYQLICDIDDHLTRGQQAVFSVNEPVNE